MICAQPYWRKICAQTGLFSSLTRALRCAILPVMLAIWACAPQLTWAQDGGWEPGAPTNFPSNESSSSELAPLQDMVVEDMVVEDAPVAPAIIENAVAVFSGLDKITGRIWTFDVYIGETVEFGALQVTPRQCNTRPPTEPPHTTAFVEVNEITLENQMRRLFSGWMFEESPALNAVDHPIYDVWLIDCKTSSDSPPPQDYAGPPIIETAQDSDLPPLTLEQQTARASGERLVGGADPRAALLPRSKPDVEPLSPGPGPGPGVDPVFE